MTGGGSGIGAALARAVRRGGRDAVVVADLPTRQRTRWPRRSAGRPSTAVDVTDAAAVAALVERMLARHGRIDLFCSNAGIPPGWARRPDDLWHRAFEVNIMAHVYAARAVVPDMLARGQRLPAQHRLGRRPADLARATRRTRSPSTARSRSPSGWRSPTATAASASACCARWAWPRRC